MPSPFPGMDPYLEEPKRWPLFRHQFVVSLYQVLMPSLVDRYRARMSNRNYTLELPLFTSVQREPHAEEHVELRDRSDGRLVTLIDVVSIANRTTQTGREAYLETRNLAEANKAAVVEIDLLTQGAPMLDFPRDNLPEFDYAITVTRPSTPGRFEIYTSSLQKRLPKFRIPLAVDDRDAGLELQDVFRRAYDLAGFSTSIDYTADLPPEVKLTVENHQWTNAWLRQQKRR